MRISPAAMLILVFFARSLPAGENVARPLSAAFSGRGYDLLQNKAYLPADFDQQTFDEIWKCWEEPLRSQAEKQSSEWAGLGPDAPFGLLYR